MAKTFIFYANRSVSITDEKKADDQKDEVGGGWRRTGSGEPVCGDHVLE